MHHAPPKSVLTRLKRIEGQVRGVSGMVEEGRYCIDILTQVQAIKAALGKVEEAIRDGDAESQRQKFTELVDLFGRYRN
jgi:DNA-binding FrmR family transcriptional regulator